MIITIDSEKMREIGENILVIEDGDQLILVIDTSVTGKLSSSGKMRSVAQTGGFVSMPGNLKGNVWIGKKA